MSLRTPLTLIFAGLVSVAATGEIMATAGKLRCSLTEKVIEKCCCVEREGKTHCTLASEDVSPCCCRPAEAR